MQFLNVDQGAESICHQIETHLSTQLSLQNHFVEQVKIIAPFNGSLKDNPAKTIINGKGLEILLINP